MMLGNRVRPGLLLLAATLALAASAPTLAGDARPTGDDKCIADCDAESDKCAQEAGKDGSKQRQCDSAYDECLRKCG